MTQEFQPVVYLKNGCPFCFKLRVALLELGSINKVEIRAFSTGTPEEVEIRQLLSANLEKFSFPTVEISPGEFRGESDELILYFADKIGVDPKDLPTLSAYIDGPFEKLMRLSKENKQLKRSMAA